MTARPRWAARQAMASPMTPPPITSTSAAAWARCAVGFLIGIRSLRRHDPDQVPAVGGCQPPSQSGRTGLPRAAHSLAPGQRAGARPGPWPAVRRDAAAAMMACMTEPPRHDDPATPAADGLTGLQHVVVAGAGLAGLRTIEELRRAGYGGRITLVGAEPRLPYDRPPLSKKLMIGALDDTTLRTELDSLRVDVRLAERATWLGDGVLATDRAEIGFDALVLATGALPVTLPGEGRQHVLRTLDDALELRKLLTPGVTLAIVGAGWIGAELATAAAQLGCRVTVLEAGPTPLAVAVGTEIGGITS